MELEAVYNFSLSVIKRSLQKWKQNHQKDASHLKNNKNSSNSNSYKEDIEKGEGNEKRKVWEESNSAAMTIKFFTFILHTWKWTYFAQRHRLGKVVYTVALLVKFLLVFAGYRFESCCCHLNFRYHACFEQGVP